MLPTGTFAFQEQLSMRLLTLVLGLSVNALIAQDLGNRHEVLQEVAIPGMPGLHSFAWGQHNGEWL